jgi:hypothetical protein
MNTPESLNRGFSPHWTVEERAALYAEATRRAHAARREAMQQFWQSIGNAAKALYARLRHPQRTPSRQLCL